MKELLVLIFYEDKLLEGVEYCCWVEVEGVYVLEVAIFMFYFIEW